MTDRRGRRERRERRQREVKQGRADGQEEAWERKRNKKRKEIMRE